MLLVLLAAAASTSAPKHVNKSLREPLGMLQAEILNIIGEWKYQQQEKSETRPTFVNITDIP